MWYILYGLCMYICYGIEYMIHMHIHIYVYLWYMLLEVLGSYDQARPGGINHLQAPYVELARL